MYYKDGYTYVVVYDRLGRLERKLKGMWLNTWDENKLNRIKLELIEELKYGN